MKIFKINSMSAQVAIILSAFIVGISIFITTWVFFGGDGNKQKLFIENSTPERPINSLTPEQIKKIQEQRAAQMKKAAETETATATSTEETEN